MSTKAHDKGNTESLSRVITCPVRPLYSQLPVGEKLSQRSERRGSEAVADSQQHQHVSLGNRGVRDTNSMRSRDGWGKLKLCDIMGLPQKDPHWRQGENLGFDLGVGSCHGMKREVTWLDLHSKCCKVSRPGQTWETGPVVWMTRDGGWILVGMCYYMWKDTFAFIFMGSGNQFLVEERRGD